MHAVDLVFDIILLDIVKVFSIHKFLSNFNPDLGFDLEFRIRKFRIKTQCEIILSRWTLILGWPKNTKPFVEIDQMFCLIWSTCEMGCTIDCEIKFLSRNIKKCYCLNRLCVASLWNNGLSSYSRNYIYGVGTRFQKPFSHLWKNVHMLF